MPALGADQALPTVATDDSAHRAQRLLAALRAIASARDLSGVMGAVRHARRLAVADGATFALSEGAMVHYVDEDAIAPLWKGRRFPAKACLSGLAMLRRESLVVEDVQAERRGPLSAYRHTFVRSLAIVPIGREAPVGAIGVYWATPGRPAPRELAALEALAEAAAMAVANAALLAKLSRAVALRDELIAQAAQELDGPLAAVRLRTDGAARGSRGLLGGPDLAAIHEPLARLGETVTALREFSRASEEGTALARAPVDLADVARTVIEGLRGRAAAAGTELRLSAPRVVVGEWDGGRLARAVGHLVEAAVRAGPGGRVNVAVEEEPGEGRVTVVRRRDAGVRREVQERVRVAGERAAAPESPGGSVGGLGSGLWTARSIAEAHGGTVTVEGASFCLRLPTRAF